MLQKQCKVITKKQYASTPHQKNMTNQTNFALNKTNTLIISVLSYLAQFYYKMTISNQAVLDSTK